MLRLLRRTMDSRLPDAVTPYVRPNALTRKCPVFALDPILETSEFRFGCEKQWFWLLLKPGSSDIVFENGVIEWAITRRHSNEDGTTHTLLENAVREFQRGLDGMPVRLYRELPISWWVDLGFYAVMDRFDLSGLSSIRFWLKPMMPQVGIPSGMTEISALRRLTGAQIECLMDDASICCQYCGRTDDLSIGALDAEGHAMIVCRQVGCLDESTDV